MKLTIVEKIEMHFGDGGEKLVGRLPPALPHEHNNPVFVRV